MRERLVVRAERELKIIKIIEERKLILGGEIEEELSIPKRSITTYMQHIRQAGIDVRGKNTGTGGFYIYGKVYNEALLMKVLNGMKLSCRGCGNCKTNFSLAFSDWVCLKENKACEEVLDGCDYIPTR